MFFVITQRVVKHPRGGGEKYAPRSANVVTWHVAGPFTKRPLAERSAASTLATHTCLNAQVVDAAQLLKLSKASDYDQPDYALGRALNAAVKQFNVTQNV